MPKHEAGSAKAIANKQKSVGLQRLRWYCEMCQKQCRDENGFKCHTQGENHLRQMRLFAEDPSQFMDKFSKEFEEGFMDVLMNRHGSKRMKANSVYGEYIANKTATHMTATKWTTLTEFVKYLGREGICVVDETEQGWFVQYIDRDPKLMEKQRQIEQNQLLEMDEETRQQRVLDAQIKAAEKRKLELLLASGGASEPEIGTTIDMVRERNIKISLQPLSSDVKNGGAMTPSLKKSRFSSAFDDEDDSRGDTGSSSSSGSVGGSSVYPSTKMSVLDELIVEEERKKTLLMDAEDRASRKENWLHRNIYVKIINKKIFDGKYYKERGVVKRILEDDEFVGDVELKSGVVIRLDQDDLQTVIPKVDESGAGAGAVLVVNGLGRGSKGVVLAINEKDFDCDVRITNGVHVNKVLKKKHEEISKLGHL